MNEAPNKAAVRRLVNKGVALKIEIATKEKALKAVNRKLGELGVRFSDEWQPTDGGGNSWIARGTGYKARVTYPIRKLRDAINAAAKDFVKIRQAAGDAFKHLFEAANYYKPVDGFRKKAVEILGASKGEKLIKLCESDNEPKVHYEISDGQEEREAA
jgi:hypothetical protein